MLLEERDDGDWVFTALALMYGDGVCMLYL